MSGHPLRVDQRGEVHGDHGLDGALRLFLGVARAAFLLCATMAASVEPHRVTWALPLQAAPSRISDLGNCPAGHRPDSAAEGQLGDRRPVLGRVVVSHLDYRCQDRSHRGEGDHDEEQAADTSPAGPAAHVAAYSATPDG
jgi:hypothetical protein